MICYSIKVLPNPLRNYPGCFYNFQLGEWESEASPNNYTFSIREAEAAMCDGYDAIGDVVLEQYHLIFDHIMKRQECVPSFECSTCRWIFYNSNNYCTRCNK